MKKLFCIIRTFLFMCPVTAFANSAQLVWEGRTYYGTAITGEKCPLVVEKEILTLDIPQGPEMYYSEEHRLKEYSSVVTAQYTFKNPADYDVNATLVFPFGNLPYYIEIYDQETGIRNILPDEGKYSVTADGEEIGREVRYTFSPGKFDVTAEMPKVKDSYTQDPFFYPDMTVTKYTYVTEGIGTEESPWDRISLSWKNETDKTALLPGYFSHYSSMGTDSAIMEMEVKSGAEIILYTIGAPLSQPPALKPVTTAGNKYASVSLAKTETMTLENFIFAEWDKYEESRGISKTDWYNIYIDCFNHNMMDSKKIIDCYSRYYNMQNSLMVWYKYDLSVPAGLSVVNTVTAPLYPAQDHRYEPPVFGYTYYLSPAATWADFGDIEINVNTPYYITESSIEFEKSESGYHYAQSGLPRGELTLKLSESEKPVKTVNKAYIGMSMFIIVGYSMALIAGFAVIILIFRIISKITAK